MTDNETGVSAPVEDLTPHVTIILALSFFRSVIQSSEPWTEHCQEAYRSAIDALGTPSVSAPANQVDARWKRLAMQAMRYLNAEQLAAATKAAGIEAHLCGASNPLMEAPVSAPAEDRTPLMQSLAESDKRAKELPQWAVAIERAHARQYGGHDSTPAEDRTPDDATCVICGNPQHYPALAEHCVGWHVRLGDPLPPPDDPCAERIDPIEAETLRHVNALLAVEDDGYDTLRLRVSDPDLPWTDRDRAALDRLLREHATADPIHRSEAGRISRGRALPPVRPSAHLADLSDIANANEYLRSENARLTAALDRMREDAERLDWLEREVARLEVVRLEFTEAGSEAGDYGSVLSSWPRGFWINDGDGRDHSTLREAIDADRTQPEGSNE